jgi:hypothetical protein
MGQGKRTGNGGVGWRHRGPSRGPIRTGGPQFFTALRLLILKAAACAADRTGVKAALIVQKRAQSLKPWPTSKAVLGTFMLGLFLFLHVLAASEVLHQELHRHDCDHPEETCVVTLLSQGLLESPVAEVPIPLVSTFETFVSHTVETFVGFPISRLLPGRAPPAGLLA